MSWLQEHLETFVKPYLGFIPEAGPAVFTKEQMTVIKNCWRSAKAQAKGKTILLPGRDVFVFEILARRENYPTVFVPGCSRQTASFLDLKVPADTFLLDTGFMGSIPQSLRLKNFKLLSFFDRGNNVGTQVFPRLTLSRNLALAMEATPKYWQSARMVNGEVVQILSNHLEFGRAAKLTIDVYKDSSPRFIERPRVLGQRRGDGLRKHAGSK